MTSKSDLREAFSRAMSTAEGRAGSLPLDEPRLTDARRAIKTEIALGFSKALADYLNTAVDPTGDGLLVPMLAPRLLPFGAALFAHSAVTNNDAIAGITDSAVRAAWASLNPLAFAPQTPPVPGGVKLSSIAVLTPMGPMTGLYKQGSKDGFLSYLSDAVHLSLTTSVCTVLHTVPAPSGQAPGPPLVLPLR